MVVSSECLASLLRNNRSNHRKIRFLFSQDVLDFSHVLFSDFSRLFCNCSVLFSMPQNFFHLGLKREVITGQNTHCWCGSVQCKVCSSGFDSHTGHHKLCWIRKTNICACMLPLQLFNGHGSNNSLSGTCCFNGEAQAHSMRTASRIPAAHTRFRKVSVWSTNAGVTVLLTSIHASFGSACCRWTQVDTNHAMYKNRYKLVRLFGNNMFNTARTCQGTQSESRLWDLF